MTGMHSRPAASDDRHDLAVFGAGSWGTALAMQSARIGHRVLLWARDEERARAIDAARCNENYLPNLRLPDGVFVTASLEEAVASARELLLVVPSHAFAALVDRLVPLLGADRTRPRGLSWACKGFEPGTGRLLHEVAAERLPAGTPLAAVTGPSFAVEVARDLPTAVTVAGTDEDYPPCIAALLHGGSFRAYTSTDLVGAELGGAIKNVLAVATGIGDGMGLGDNARAALITRGLAEMMRLGDVLGARRETLTGLAGMGDLVLTCTGDQSRNRRLGLALGRGASVDQAVADIGQVVEGISAAAEVHRLAQLNDLSMPISEEVYGIIHRGWDPEESVRRLLAREQKPED
jgi:glycerol-3-phosphate dehydrogenase (NAD(P)+)